MKIDHGKDITREVIEIATEEFLEAGGEIKVIPPGQEPIRLRVMAHLWNSEFLSGSII